MLSKPINTTEDLIKDYLERQKCMFEYRLFKDDELSFKWAISQSKEI